MALRNTTQGYGLVARVLHWLMALAIFGLFGLGLWMRTLDYYSPYYQSAPALHQSIGITLLVLLILRFVWKLINTFPAEDDLNALEKVGSKILHWGFYPLLFALMIAGYLISTLDGRSIVVFGLIEVPSVYEQKGLERTAGYLHWLLAWTTVVVACGHIGAGLYHHFVKRDRVLLRMLRGG